nr:hypothetical protein Iba_chr14cCG14000 [Ipomoea batatas]
MRHFEKDISTKPSLHISTPGPFTFTEITETIFPHKNPVPFIPFRTIKQASSNCLLWRRVNSGEDSPENSVNPFRGRGRRI